MQDSLDFLEKKKKQPNKKQNKKETKNKKPNNPNPNNLKTALIQLIYLICSSNFPNEHIVLTN